MLNRMRNRRQSGELSTRSSEPLQPLSGREGREALLAIRAASIDRSASTVTPTFRDPSSRRTFALKSATSRSSGSRTPAGSSENSSPRPGHSAKSSPRPSASSRPGDGSGVEATPSMSSMKSASMNSEVDNELQNLMSSLTWENTPDNIAQLESVIQSWTDAISETRHALRSQLTLSKIKVQPVREGCKTGEGRLVSDGCSDSQKQGRLQRAARLIDQLSTRQHWKSKCESLLLMRDDPQLFAYTHQMVIAATGTRQEMS